MSRIVAMTACGLALVVVSGRGSVAQQGTSTSSHVMSTAAELKWGEAPPALPKGAKLVVLSGDPGKAGPFAVRLRMPAGYRIAPHWHPTDEHVTVLSGTFSMGMGEKFDAKALKALPAGGYAMMPAEARHYAMTRGGATVQVHGTGPLVLNYVNPADDPSKAAAK
ncbi:MAG TPA: cupin domain-containing protein [Gemmatimonadales bacterium]|nr:cupin domain-containing protein [Gemmatimonadales bacterium]